MGQRDQAMAELARSKEIDPGPSSSGAELAALYQLRDFKGLIAAGQRQVTSNPNEWTGYTNLGVGYEGAGDLQAAVVAYQKAVEISDGGQDPIASLAHAYAAIGRRTEAEKLLNELLEKSRVIYVSPYVIATVYAGLGEKEKAFEFLEKAYQERSLNLSWHIRADVRIDNLRPDPRFRELLRRFHLESQQ
jgi:tetratricopeptide (TPR) repeat protein